MKPVPMEGQRFGRLVVVERAETVNGRIKYRCICDCGNEHVASGSLMREGNIQSCGCARAAVNKMTNEQRIAAGLGPRKSRSASDMTGRVYNRLTVLALDRAADNGARMWRCRCECGNETVVDGAAMRAGRIKSCGCFRVEHSREMLPKWKAKGEANRAAGIGKTRLGTRVIRRDGVTVHRMDAINDGGRSVTHPGPSKYGRPDLFALQWPAPGTVGVEA